MPLQVDKMKEQVVIPVSGIALYNLIDSRWVLKQETCEEHM